MKRTKTFLAFLALVMVVMLIATGCSGKAKEQRYFSMDELQGPDIRFSLWLGCGYEPYVAEAFPQGQNIFGSYVPDLALNVRQNKADAMVLGESFFNYFYDELSDMVILDGDIGTIQGALIFSEAPMGESLRLKFNTWLASAYADGTIDELKEKWLSIEKDDQTIDFDVLDPSWEHIRVGVALDEPPYAFQKGQQHAGYDVELIARFCRDNEYYPEYEGADYDAMITAIQTDKYDVIGAGYELMEERTESVSFGDPSRVDRVIVAVQGAEQKVGFIDSVRRSFTRTFIEENRYMQFLKGIGVTFIMTISSMIFGTALGFGLYFLDRDGGKVVQKCIGVLSTLVHRIPTVVLLMILYYIVFGNVNISNVIVSTLFFTIAFGVSTFEGIDLAISSVGKGQTEAAFTLGLTRNETFFKVLLPQGRPIFVSSFKDNVISTLLESAVAGYIAVMDLTRVGDIIRNNTYEAFFPLIAVAIFYLLISSLIITVVDRVEKKTDPVRRSPEAIFKSATGREYTEPKVSSGTHNT